MDPSTRPSTLASVHNRDSEPSTMDLLTRFLAVDMSRLMSTYFQHDLAYFTLSTPARAPEEERELDALFYLKEKFKRMHELKDNTPTERASKAAMDICCFVSAAERRLVTMSNLSLTDTWTARRSTGTGLRSDLLEALINSPKRQTGFVCEIMDVLRHGTDVHSWIEFKMVRLMYTVSNPVAEWAQFGADLRYLIGVYDTVAFLDSRDKAFTALATINKPIFADRNPSTRLSPVELFRLADDIATWLRFYNETVRKNPKPRSALYSFVMTRANTIDRTVTAMMIFLFTTGRLIGSGIVVKNADEYQEEIELRLWESTRRDSVAIFDKFLCCSGAPSQILKNTIAVHHDELMQTLKGIGETMDEDSPSRLLADLVFHVFEEKNKGCC